MQSLAILGAHTCGLYFFASCLCVCNWNVLHKFDPFWCIECRDRTCDLRKHFRPQTAGKLAHMAKVTFCTVVVTFTSKTSAIQTKIGISSCNFSAESIRPRISYVFSLTRPTLFHLQSYLKNWHAVPKKKGYQCGSRGGRAYYRGHTSGAFDKNACCFEKKNNNFNNNNNNYNNHYTRVLSILINISI